MATQTRIAEQVPTRQALTGKPHGKRNFAALVRTDPLSTVITISIDVLSATISVAVGVWWASRTLEIAAPMWMVALFVPWVIVILGLRGVYHRKLARRFLDEIGPVQTAVTLAAMLVLSTLVFGGVPGRQGALVSRIWICAAVLMLLGRLIRVGVQRDLRDRHHLMSPTLIVGNGRVAHKIIERLKTSPQYGLTPVGLLCLDTPQDGSNNDPRSGVPRLGSPESIEEAIAGTGAEAVIVAFLRMPDELLTNVVRIAHQHGLRVWVVPRMFDVVGERTRVEHLGGLPLLAVPHTNPHGWQFVAKDISDRVLAGVGLLLISPLFCLVMGLVWVSSAGPVFFRQERVGRDGEVFECLKFRTMRAPLASDAAFSPQDGKGPGGVEGVDRRTRIGKILRATSMDELPQLINVFKGEMSLVGPRPERPEFVELFEMQIRRYGDRHRVKAGLTGWAQVNGLRGHTSIAERAEWDNYYIENWSLALDIKILALTVLAVLRRAE